MTALAKVVEIKENNVARVQSQRMSACASCENCSSKGACEAQLVFGNTSCVFLEVKNTLSARVGDTVQLSSSTPKMLFTSFFVFVVPVLLSVLAYFLAEGITHNTFISSVCLGVVFAAAFVAGAVFMNSYAKKCISIEIVKIVEEGAENSAGEL